MTDQDRLAALEGKVNLHTDHLLTVDTRLTTLETKVVPPAPSPLAKAWASFLAYFWPPFKLFAPGVALQTGVLSVLLLTGTLTAPGCVGPTPTPIPIPIPIPTDPFVTALQAAYTAETDPNKAAQVAILASIYKGSGPVVSSSATSKEILDAMHAAAEMALPGALPKVRGAIAMELNKTLGTANVTLDANLRALIGVQFARVQTALGAMK